MTRKAIPDETQTSILLKSRRRCCLCFWLKGEDEVKKGQLAHLDGDHENDAESNLAFMCFEHHDEYDSTTRLSKGLREKEVKRWRDELYREMEYRFLTVKRHGFELTLIGFGWLGPDDEFKAAFRVKNTGDVAVRSPTVSIRLPNGVGGELPDKEIPVGPPMMGMTHTVRIPSPWKAAEETSDLFEPNGRVCIKVMGGMNPVLMPGHNFEFEALQFRLSDFPEGSQIELECRVDAEEVPPVMGKVLGTVPLADDMIRASSQ